MDASQVTGTLCADIRGTEAPLGMSSGGETTQAVPAPCRTGRGMTVFQVTYGDREMCPDLGRSSSDPRGPRPSKLIMRVRFPSPALSENAQITDGFV
jgi:hypothetical protein